VGRVRQSFIDSFLHHVASVYPIERLDALTTRIADGVHQRPSYTEDGIPFLTVENLTRSDGIDFGDVRYVPRSDHEVFIRRAHPERGDVLVSKDGTLGVARVVETEAEFSIFVSIAVLKPRSDVLLPHYLRAYFDSGHFKSVLAAKTSGSALKHIHLVDFRAMQVPVPPIEAQRAFVAELGVISASLEALGEEAVRLHGTKGALLAEIFRGAN
jgi:restriction endonuclease S subunit